jgi:hypothetical protein
MFQPNVMVGNASGSGSAPSIAALKLRSVVAFYVAGQGAELLPALSGWHVCGHVLYLFQAAGMPQRAKRSMSLSWVLLGLIGWAFGLVVVLALFRMAGDQDRAARHEQKRLDPYSDVTITRAGDA